MRRFVLFFTTAMLAFGQRAVTTSRDHSIRGAALDHENVFTWGECLLRWDVSKNTQQLIAASAHGGFGEGGCIDPQGTFYLQDGIESGPLIAISPKGRRTEWDRKVEMHDCIATQLLGHRGVLITDHYGQVRFYEGPSVYQELYSFYTPSRQAGLLLADVDQDGLPDIFAGNYWIRSPKEFDLPWRLFAVNTRRETPDSATMRLVLFGRELIAAQGHMAEGLLLRYTPTADPTQLWTEQVIASGLHYPHALASGGIGIVVGENNGPGSRLWIARDRVHLNQIGITNGAHTAFVIGGRILTVGAAGLSWWDVQRRK